MLERVEVLNLRNSGETRSRAPRDGETGAHLSTPLADHADVAPKALRRFVGAHLVRGESETVRHSI